MKLSNSIYLFVFILKILISAHSTFFTLISVSSLSSLTLLISPIYSEVNTKCISFAYFADFDYCAAFAEFSLSSLTSQSSLPILNEWFRWTLWISWPYPNQLFFINFSEFNFKSDFVCSLTFAELVDCNDFVDFAYYDNLTLAGLSLLI